MSTSSTLSIPLILMRENSKRAVVFTIELLRGQALPPVFMNLDIIGGLVYEAYNCRANGSAKTG